MTPREKVRLLYPLLFKTYGFQGWWPIVHSDEASPRTMDAGGYHPGIYDIPRTDQQKLEIMLGAILTQNTNWNNVVTALSSLATAGLFSIQGLIDAKMAQIALAIRSAGYYNQKAQYLKNLVGFLDRFPLEKLERETCSAAREKLLGIGGIGPETADSILLYALKKPSFVIDTYTRRILSGAGIISGTENYQTLKQLFESSLVADLSVFQEYHALLVQHGKRYYSRKPYGREDGILRSLRISGIPGGERHAPQIP
ncbi:endonuclease III domain-containing protein [bacterium]|nr:endonuclease III domain-containing protein [bacterium]